MHQKPYLWNIYGIVIELQLLHNTKNTKLRLIKILPANYFDWYIHEQIFESRSFNFLNLILVNIAQMMSAI